MRGFVGFVACVTLAVGASVLTEGEARAAGPLAPQGAPLTTSSYAIDLFQGPVLAGSRATGLAGAYAPLATGADGLAFNAAAAAVRDPWSTDRVDYGVFAGVTFPSSLVATDFDNNGTRGFTYDSFVFVTAGGSLQIEGWGLGLSVDLQQYDLGQSASAATIPNGRLRYGSGHGDLGYAFLDGQLVVGGGVRGALLALVDASDGEKLLLQMTGVAPEVGAVWAPHDLPVRAGLTGRLPVKGQADLGNRAQPDANGDTHVNGVFLPSSIVMPWEIEGGVAFQIGRRPLNIPWSDARKTGEKDPKRAKEAARARYRAIPREKLLVTASVLVSGPVADGVGFESFLAQRVDRSGLSATVSPRVGVEGEPWLGRLQVRGGGYLEPSRFVESSPRLHETLGFDVKLFEWSVFGLFPEHTGWRIGAVTDLARNYFGWGAVLGNWH